MGIKWNLKRSEEKPTTPLHIIILIWIILRHVRIPRNRTEEPGKLM